MNSKPNQQQWSHYLETPLKQSSPVKLDQILEERLRAFMKAREARMFMEEQNTPMAAASKTSSS